MFLRTIEQSNEELQNKEIEKTNLTIADKEESDLNRYYLYFYKLIQKYRYMYFTDQ